MVRRASQRPAGDFSKPLQFYDSKTEFPGVEADYAGRGSKLLGAAPDTSRNSTSHGWPLNFILATLIGRSKRRGPALPGFRNRMPPRSARAGLCECPLTMM